ncbi:MAG: glycoside hydrolase family 3 N-terminal domain-containing protein [Agromyces sp.]
MKLHTRVPAALAVGLLAFLAFTEVTPRAVPTPTRPVPNTRAAAIAIDVDELRIQERIASMNLDAKLAQLMIVHCAGLNPVEVSACVGSAGASGAILMGDNIGPNPSAVAALTSALPDDAVFPMLVAIDEEGGEVARLAWDTLPGGEALANTPVEDTRATFAQRALLLREVGVNLNFGVVADVTDDRNSFLFSRVLGHDPQSVTDRVVAAVAGEGTAVASTLKHFPGHGAASGNSHTEIPVSQLDFASWLTSAAVPFVAGINAGAPVVMMGHIVFPNVDSAPASLSPVWNRILRDQLGFRGVVVSDDLLMLQHNGIAEFADPATNALRALQAGTDLLLWVLPADPVSAGVNLTHIRASLAAAVSDGRLLESQVDSALARVLRLRLELGRAR